MIIVRTLGGLGNQMFQFAMGAALAKRLNTIVKCDISDFNNYDLHQGFELNKVFHCEAEIANSVDISNVLGTRGVKPIRNFLKRESLSWLRGADYILERNLSFEKSYLNLSDNKYLVGYWQSENYFEDAEELIRNKFQFRNDAKEVNSKLIHEIEQTDSVALHVRRGDYLSNNAANSFHGVCTIEYYNFAIEKIQGSVKSPVFYVFSDDPGWAMENIRIESKIVYVDCNRGANSYLDMMLMSKCKHNIIANSTFSWWGAWLNENEDKVVIRPKNWFASNSNNYSSICPSSWVAL